MIDTTQPDPETLIAVIRAHGNDATNLRDAAHEAHHAIEAGVPAGKWDRETIHRYVMRMRQGDAARSEIRSRAVEQIVCRRFGVDCGTVEHWSFIACMEAMKYRIPFFQSVDTVVDLVTRTMATPEAEAMADAVMALRAPTLAAKRARRARKAVPQ
jgi:hypothetical protein